MKNSTIKRRDFLNGVALTSLAAATPFRALAFGAVEGAVEGAAESAAQDYYPPLLNGMRGSHKGSFEAAHALVMQGIRPSDYERVDDVYDLVIVGGGISGLAAAYQYRKQIGVDAKILVLDNHDDFGGHAKRNEFQSGGKTLLSFGGSINLEQNAMSPAAYQLLEEIGVDFKALQDASAEDYSFSNGEAPFGLYLGGDLYSEDQMVAGPWVSTWAGVGNYRAQIQSLSLPKEDIDKLISLAGGEKNYLADVALADKEKYLHNTSYASFLYERVGLSAPAARLVEPWARAIFGVGIEGVSVREAFALGAPGYNAIGLPVEEAQDDEHDYRSPMFPDGNASVARLFVRKLIPEVAPGNSMQDLITARFDYSMLDRRTSPVRVRLNSTAVNVTHHGKKAVDVSYVTGGRAFKVRGKHCILAGYNGMIPHLCPELPKAQKESLAYGVKTPFVWANVLLNTGAAVRQVDASVVQCPGSVFELVAHAPPVTLGDYSPPSTAKDPMVMFMGNVPAPHTKGDQSARDVFRLGRHKLFTTPFADYEAAIIEQLSGMFGRHGFDAKRDIEAITLNRWSHGYAYEYMDLYDPSWKKGQAPHELGRKPFGRISIANSDSEAYAYVQAAIDAAIRAVGEVSA
ncbi:MAG: NAD(P)-binding protein [Pseudomonadales bacterium]